MTLGASFTVVSLFAGCGGSSLGYKLAGGRVAMAVEWERNAVETYKRNHPDTVVLHRDIAKVSADEILTLCKLQPGELDILDGSPPCQGFSTVGKRHVTDQRNRLFVEYVRLLQALEPKVFVMENVPGLVRGKMKPVFDEILTTLRGCGYDVKAKLMNAQYYDVPQSRARIIFIGVRTDLGIPPCHPAPQSAPKTIQEALSGLPVCHEVLRPIGKALRIAECLQPGQDGSRLYGRLGAKASYYSLKRLAWHEVAPTICRTIRPGQCGLIHPDGSRYLSIPELKRIASFPDDYQFIGSIEEQWARIGNSVPPKMMQVIASHIHDHILAPAAELRSYKKEAVCHAEPA
jgi:DNA (cytosine-5)-methyltransferase 1